MGRADGVLIAAASDVRKTGTGPPERRDSGEVRFVPGCGTRNGPRRDRRLPNTATGRADARTAALQRTIDHRQDRRN